METPVYNKVMTLKQYDIADTIIAHGDCIDKQAAIEFTKSIFGSTAELKDIVIAYDAIEW